MLAFGQAHASCWGNSPLSWSGLAAATFEWTSPEGDCSQGELTLTVNNQSPVAIQGIVATGIEGFSFEADKAMDESSLSGSGFALIQRGNSIQPGEEWVIRILIDPVLSLGGIVTQQGSWSLTTTTLAAPDPETASAVPEPSTYVLMVACLLSIPLVMRGTKKEQQRANNSP